MNRGVERAHAVRILTILVFLGAMGATAALEPDGPITFRPSWSEPDPEARAVEFHGPGSELILDVVPDVTIRDAALEFRLPPGVAGAPLAVSPDVDVETELERDGTTVVRVGLGRLDRATVRRLRFRLGLEGIDGAVTTFTVLGVDRRGDLVRDACGVVVGVPGGVRPERHGAVEYRAVPIPDPTASAP